MSSAVREPESVASPEDGTPRPIRVVIQQPSLAKYRLPVYREFANRVGIDLELLYGAEPAMPNVAPEGLEARYIKHTIVPGFRWMPAHFAAVRERAADVAILTGNVRHLSLMPALRIARRSGVATVLWSHGYSKHARGFMDTVRRKALDLGDAVLLYNNTARATLAAQGIPEEKLFVALNSLDQQPIRAARERALAEPQRLAALQQERGIDPAQTLLYVSRLDPANRVDMLIEAAAKLRPEFPRLTVVVVGKGEQLSDLEALAAQRDVTDVVRFLGAVYDEDELATWFCSSAAFCYPANIGLSLLHAFGYGLPAVTSDRVSAQNPEIEAIEPGVNGLLYADGSADDLARTLADLLRNEELRSRLSAGALRTVETRFSVPNMVDGMLAACRYAAEKRSRARRR